jgi:hypothetical protein
LCLDQPSDAEHVARDLLEASRYIVRSGSNRQ